MADSKWYPHAKYIQENEFCFELLHAKFGRPFGISCAGGEPLVVAKGGFSGVAPDSSSFAYTLAQQTSLGSTLLYCDVQFTKDSQAFCQSNMNLLNTTTISLAFPELTPKTYKINGNDTSGWWGVDFSAEDLFKNVFCKLFNRYGILFPSCIFQLKKASKISCNY